MRKYEVIWEQIKKASANADQWVEVKVSDPEYMQTIYNMVCVEKSRAQVSRKALDLPSFGRLEIRKEPKNNRILFRLRDSGDAL